jgi:hypothetical protein
LDSFSQSHVAVAGLMDEFMDVEEFLIRLNWCPIFGF